MHPDQFETLRDRARHQAEARADARSDRAPHRAPENPPPTWSTRSTCAACRSTSTSARSCRAPSSANCWIPISAARADDQGGSLIDDRLAIGTCSTSAPAPAVSPSWPPFGFPTRTMDAVDISKDALERRRAQCRRLWPRRPGDVPSGRSVQSARGRRYDLIISNPPYVDAQGMAELPRECRAEPKLAFDGGADGIEIVRRILQAAKQHLTPAGGLLCEIGRCRRAGGRLPQHRFSLARNRRIPMARRFGSAPPICERFCRIWAG